MALNNGNDIALKVGFDIDRFTSELSKTNSLLNNWGNQMRSIVTNAFGFYAVQRFATEVVTSLAQFEKSMSEVKAITQATGKEFDALRDNALNLAGAFKAIDISKLETEFGRLGFSTQEILDSTAATISLASATGSDLATSATIAGSTLRAFNLDAKEMNRVADVMAGALNRTGLDMSSFAEAIKYVAPNAYAANISLEETSALLGVLADNGIKGSMAGTSLRRIIQDLAKDGRPLNERLAELGAKGLNAADAMEEVGRIGSTGLLILTKNTDKVANLAGQLHNVTGEAQAMSEVMQDNLIGDWNKLAAIWDRILNQNGGGLNGFLRDVTQNLANQLKVWDSDKISIFEKIFGGAGDYARFVKIIDDAEKKAKEAAASMVGGGEIDPTTGLPIGGGTPYVKPVTNGSPYYSKDSKESIDAVNKISNESWFSNDQMITDTTNAMQKWGAAAVEAGKDLDTLKNVMGEGITDEFGEMTAAIDLTEGSFDSLGLVAKKWATTAATIQRIGSQLRSSLVNVFGGIGQAIGQAFSKSGDIEKILLGTLGGVLVQLGHMALEIGIGLDGIKIALETLNPAAAIAAGIGLIALGSYFSSQSQSMASSIGGVGNNGSNGGVRLSPQVVDVNVTGIVKGSDLVLVLQKQGYNNGRVGG